MIRVTENLRKIRDLLAIATSEAEREPGAVRLLAVSKKQPVDKILAAAAAGQRDFGENFVQEGLLKIAQTRDQDLVWHFIGRLQSNKTRDVANYFDWVHTVDNKKTATRLSRQRPDTMKPLNICLQVNIDREACKSGVDVETLPELAAACIELPNISLRGLMCLPAVRQDFDAQRLPFALLRQLSENLGDSGISTDTLSMGMSSDYRAAIHEGANIVRIGTAIFGERT